jgi:putative ABC transport system permease protein
VRDAKDGPAEAGHDATRDAPGSGAETACGKDIRLAERIARLYPPSFRAALGDDFVRALADLMCARRRAGMSNASIHTRAVVDALRNAPGAWLESVRDRRGPADEPQRSSTMMDKLRQDVRYALRTWRRRPAFAAIAILTLALGIGANTAMFSIVNAVLLRPLPFKDGRQLVMLWGHTATQAQGLVSYREFVELRQRAKSFSEVGLWLSQSVNLTGGDQPQRIIGAFVSGSFFDVVGAGAERGRVFAQADSEPAASQPIVVITHAFWQRRFAGSESALGSTITLNGLPLTIVGIVAPPFDERSVPSGGWLLDCDAFIPAGLLPIPGGVAAAGPSLLSVARMKPGVTVAEANADLDVLSASLQSAFPETQTGRTAVAQSLHETIVGDARTPLLLLLGSVGLVLLIACVNVSNLLVARAVDRQKEIALRAALGANRWAVLRQLAIESAALSAVSAAIGLALGRWALQGLQWLRPPSVPIPDHIPMDGRVLAFTIATAVVVALLCGLAPAVRVSRADLSRVLQGARRATGTGRSTRDVLVVAEIALSVTLVAMSGLLIQSMLALQQVNVGFDPTNVLSLQFRLPASKYATPQAIARFFEQAIAKVRETPGIEAAAFVRRVPFSGNAGDTPYTVEGRPAAAGAELRAGQNLVTPDYFRTMRIPLTRGRDFSDRDDLHAPLVVIVNQTLAHAIWPGDDAIGKHIRVPDFHEALTVIGIVGDVKHRGAAEPAQPQLYLAHYQLPMIFTSLVARTVLPPASVANDVRRAIWSVDKDQPLWAVRPMDELVEASHGPTRFLASLLAMFSMVALVLAAVGIYGVMSYAVTERTHEIGIRMALGASADRVMVEIVRHGLVLTMIAVCAGVAGAMALGRLTRGVLFGVGPSDPITLIAAGGLLGLVSIAACYIPARRAARVDPVVALADE